MKEDTTTTPSTPSTPCTSTSTTNDAAAAQQQEQQEQEQSTNAGVRSSIDAEADNAEERLARSRDRNREHARRTRLRKKAQLQALQSRVKELQDESRVLRQTVEECSIASILLGLSSGNSGGSSGSKEKDKENDEFAEIQRACNLSSADTERTFFTMTGKRKRFVSDAGDGPPPMKLKIKGQTTLVGGAGGKSHINWKTGVYLDENGEQKQLTSEELESLRRERNRMHAKMTRDRKKLFISSVEKTIAELEQKNKQMRSILAKQAVQHAGSTKSVTPEPSPMLCPSDASTVSVPPLPSDILTKTTATTTTTPSTTTSATPTTTGSSPGSDGEQKQVPNLATSDPSAVNAAFSVVA